MDRSRGQRLCKWKPQCRDSVIADVIRHVVPYRNSTNRNMYRRTIHITALAFSVTLFAGIFHSSAIALETVGRLQTVASIEYTADSVTTSENSTPPKSGVDPHAPATLAAFKKPNGTTHVVVSIAVDAEIYKSKLGLIVVGADNRLLDVVGNNKTLRKGRQSPLGYSCRVFR